MKFKKILTAILRIIKKTVNAERSNNSITKQSDIVSNMLKVKKSLRKKPLNDIILIVAENCNSSSV